eukprot:TRINITY_DN8846_c0_g2_i2.p1 TRINITY_DN8846_c0_g2~~TRINITY_DN8846_c0_g2_i2.p1  ORF type:complete len:318 (+),score=11.15 TRINITY_DN8846_c0_g2_i2:265-1218(+)
MTCQEFDAHLDDQNTEGLAEKASDDQLSSQESEILVESTTQSILTTGLHTLPGQIISSHEGGEILQNWTSGSDFDLEQFRNPVIGVKTNDNHDAYNKEKEVFQIVNEQHEITLWGVKYVLQYLYERHKYPIFLLYCIYTCLICYSIGNIVTFYIGLQFRTYLLFISILVNISAAYIVISLCQTSIKKRYKVNLKQVVAVFCQLGGSLYLQIYSFIFQIPFNSVPLFLLSFFVTNIFACTAVAMGLLPNNRRWSDPDYQTRFFLSRTMLAFFNACGAADVYSDIALGLDAVRRYDQGYVFGIGVVLFVLFAEDPDVIF